MEERRCRGWRRSYHALRRRIDAACLLWWANGDTAREQYGWFECVTHADHWRCACGNGERRDRRADIVNDIVWEERIRPR